MILSHFLMVSQARGYNYYVNLCLLNQGLHFKIDSTILGQSDIIALHVHDDRRNNYIPLLISFGLSLTTTQCLLHCYYHA